MSMSLKIKNFRCLREVDWSPDGVCVLVGPNGAGKTTLLDAMNFLRLAYESGISKAIAASGGAYVHNLTMPSENVEFVVTQGGLTWELQIPRSIGPLNWSEELRDGPNKLAAKRPGDPRIRYESKVLIATADRPALRMIAEQEWIPPQSPIVATVRGFLIYRDYDLRQLRFTGSHASSDTRLSLNGENAFSVLRNWRDKRDTREAFEFVVREVFTAFPGVADDIEFAFTPAINTINLTDARNAMTIPVGLAPNGWLVGLLHLMAVAGAEPGTVIGFDEFENSLHPYAVRRLVRAMRAWAAKKDLTIILAGHSMALLDEFREDPSRVFVMEPSGAGETAPRRLTDYHDPEWLKQFSLGELYRHDEFGSPAAAVSQSPPAVSAS